jgi:hypothetical protein
MLLQAHEWQMQIDLNRTRRVDLATEHEISRARVTQLLNLLKLGEAAQDLLFGAVFMEVGERGVTEHSLRPLLSAPPQEQLEKIRVMLDVASLGRPLRLQRARRVACSGRG